MRRLPYLLIAAVGIGYFSILVYNTGFPGALGILTSFVLLGAGGMWGLTSRYLEGKKYSEILIVSLLFAPIPLGVGAWLSSVSQWYEARYVPSIIGLIYSIWVFIGQRKTWRIENIEGQGFIGTRPILYSWTLGAVVLIPSLFVTISSQHVGSTAVKLYNDIPWQIAMTSETLVRPAEFFPFLSGQKLAYPWSFHGFLGSLGSFAGVSASTLVTEVWPILFSFLLPLSIAFYAWRISANKWVSLLSPIAIVFFVGPQVPFNEAIRFPLPYSISPTYEFGILALLSVLIFLSYGIPQAANGKIAALVIATTSVFIAAGSKGSNGLILVAIFLAFLIHALFTQANKRFAALLTAAGGIGALAAYTMTISGDANNLNLHSLSFLAGATSLVSPLVFLMVTFVWVIGASWIIFHFQSGKLAKLWPSLAAVASGLFCLALFGHPGQSQIYFYWSIVPIIIVLSIWAMQLLFVEFGAIVMVPLLFSWGLGQVLDAQISYFFIPDVYAKFKWFVIWGLILIGISTWFFSQKPRPSISRKTISLLLASTAVISIAAQPFGDFQKVFSGPAATNAFVSITADQIEAFSKIKTATVPNELIATNHHCLTAVPVGEDCDGRSTALAAFSERRVLIEGHYNLSNPEAMALLALNDEFIYSPTPQNYKAMWDLGVRYVYVDKQIGIPVDLSEFATVIVDSENAQVWKLNAP